MHNDLKFKACITIAVKLIRIRHRSLFLCLFAAWDQFMDCVQDPDSDAYIEDVAEGFALAFHYYQRNIMFCDLNMFLVILYTRYRSLSNTKKSGRTGWTSTGSTRQSLQQRGRRQRKIRLRLRKAAKGKSGPNRGQEGRRARSTRRARSNQ